MLVIAVNFVVTGKVKPGLLLDAKKPVYQDNKGNCQIHRLKLPVWCGHQAVNQEA
jgi:hypothetical protein